MRKMKNSKGFTLMEMLIVVAIIAVLVAVMIPTMTTQLERARETADLANIRSAYAEAMVNALTGDTGSGESTTTVTMTQTKAQFQYLTDLPAYLTAGDKWADVAGATKGATIKVAVDVDGKVAFTVTPKA